MDFNKNFITIITLFLGTATSQYSPWSTPIEDLKIVEKDISVCHNKSFQLNMQAIEANWYECVLPFLPEAANEWQSDSHLRGDSDDEETAFYLFFCRNTSEYKKCWNAIVSKLNDCIPGRGNAVAQIYFAMYDHSCKNNGKDFIESRRRAAQEGALCENNYATLICQDAAAEWDSLDVCRRFAAQRKCDDSSLAECMNSQHKEISRNTLDEIQRIIQCPANYSSSSEVNSSHTLILIDFPLAIISLVYHFVAFV